MSENKYYTPKIEEFHEGFEYEVMIPEKSLWSKEVFYLNKEHINLVQYVDIQNEFTKNKIRVKCLDIEDIESFGFERCIPTEEGWFHTFKNGISLQLQYLNRNDTKGTIIIEQVMFNEPSPTVFWGIIKNKSELKFILKCIGVLGND